MSLTNKRKGNYAELRYMNIFKRLGYKFCFTSRYASRLHDDSKIDLVNLPFNVQVKAGKQKGMNPGKVLEEMHKEIVKHFPPEDIVHSKPKIVIHYKQGTRGKKRKEEDEIVYMSYKEFKSFKRKVKTIDYLGSKSIKKGVRSEYKSIVFMSFSYFIENIVRKIKNNKYDKENIKEKN